MSSSYFYGLLPFYLSRRAEGLPPWASWTLVHQCPLPDATGCTQCPSARWPGRQCQTYAQHSRVPSQGQSGETRCLDSQSGGTHCLDNQSGDNQCLDSQSDGTRLMRWIKGVYITNQMRLGMYKPIGWDPVPTQPIRWDSMLSVTPKSGNRNAFTHSIISITVMCLS